MTLSSEPDERPHEMEEAQIAPSQLLKPGEDSPVVFELADETLHQVAFSVQMLVVGAPPHTVDAWPDDRDRSPSADGAEERVGVIGGVGDHVVTCIRSDQSLRLGAVMALPPSQDEAQGVAQAIDAHMDLGAEPAATTPQGLGGLASVFLEAPAAHG